MLTRPSSSGGQHAGSRAGRAYRASLWPRPLATRVPVNDNRLLSQAFKLSLSRKQLQRHGASMYSKYDRNTNDARDRQGDRGRFSQSSSGSMLVDVPFEVCSNFNLDEDCERATLFVVGVAQEKEDSVE